MSELEEDEDYPNMLLETSMEHQALLMGDVGANPYGSNSLFLTANYRERLRYRHGNYFRGLPKPIDILYDKVYYGKTDRFQNAVVPKKTDSNLIKQASNTENVFAFNFVADAFFKLRRNLKIAGDSGGIVSEDTSFYDLQAKSGWVNYEPAYLAALRRFFEMYQIDYLQRRPPRELNKIVSYTDFMAGALNYYKKGTYAQPVTLTEFVLSPRTPANIGGIVIETALDGYGDDANKYLNYVIDPNFSYYVRAARKFGFYVDRNGPWRLFADIFSKPMLAELATYGVTQEDFFDTYFDQTWTLDIPHLKTESRKSYNAFVSANPRIVETRPGLRTRGIGGSPISTVGCPTAHLVPIGTREHITAQAIDDMSDYYWLDYYFRLRSLETRVEYKNADFLIKHAQDISNSYGYEKALIYINNLFKPYLYDEKLFNLYPLTDGPESVRIGSVTDPTPIITGGGSGY
tara:strand:- start:870 stop:2249 length:1380 start_codon:yes stop_codon:yes gene_type:complete